VKGQDSAAVDILGDGRRRQVPAPLRKNGVVQPVTYAYLTDKLFGNYHSLSRRDAGMAPSGSRLDLKHRIRRWHPFRPAMTRSLALMDHADEEAISRYQNRRLQRLVRLAAA